MNILETFTTLENSRNLFATINDSSLTYQQLLVEVKKIAVLFEEKGIHQGDTILLSASNDVDTTIFVIAALRLGVATVLMDSSVKKERAGSIIRESKPDAYIVEESLIDYWAIDCGKPIIPIKRMDKSDSKNESLGLQCYPKVMENVNPEKAKLPEYIDERSIAFIMYTSGTTSANKGVLITYKNLFTHLATLKKVYRLTENDRISNLLNLYHADGIIQGPILALYAQCTLHRPFKLGIGKIGEVFNSISEAGITHFFCVPSILSIMDKLSNGYESSFGSKDFRFIISVSSHIEEPLWRRFSEKFNVRIVNVYGLTETVAGSVFCGPGEDSFKIGTIGKPVDCEAKIINEDGKEVLQGQPGELLLKGSHVMSGYLNNETATKSALKDGWLYTGDIAICDEEGFYRITGRKKNIIVSGGFNIHPEEVTEILNMHPDVLESVSFGISDEIFGEKLISSVALKQDSGANEMILTDYCRQNLEPEKVPHQIKILSSLPKGISGKVQLEEVKKMVLL